jgi:hypothetical protein
MANCRLANRPASVIAPVLDEPMTMSGKPSSIADSVPAWSPLGAVAVAAGCRVRRGRRVGRPLFGGGWCGPMHLSQPDRHLGAADLPQGHERTDSGFVPRRPARCMQPDATVPCIRRQAKPPAAFDVARSPVGELRS